ncbi:laccase [Trifolium repens]|nr:laccase [Trifolium repens]
MECVKTNYKYSSIFIAIFVLLLSSTLSLANPKTHEHEFVVEATPVKRLCKTHNTITVNGQYPGPTLEINNGDTLVVKVINKARYNVTIHWHGVRQMRTGWADGPEFVTQERDYYPFPKPTRDTPILLGEWWDRNPIDVVRQAQRTGAAPNISDAYTINGQPGDLYKCSTKGTTTIPIHSGETNLIRVINAALNQPLFFTIANHKLTVVGADASYLKPFTTNILMLGPGLNNCPKNFRKRRCQGPINGTRFTASMNNVSFTLPNNISILQAHYNGIPGVFTTDFPANPPVKFDYTGNVSRSLWQPIPGTKAYRLKFGSRVHIVLQDTSIVTPKNHPIHLHGYDFYIVAEGFGNFDPKKDTSKFNLVDPPMRNTVAVPANGWAVIRFVADNPGAWIMHCHLDVHIGWGLATVLLVEDGVGELQSIEPPPLDLPLC